MTIFLFENFLESKKVYHAAKAFWSRQVLTAVFPEWRRPKKEDETPEADAVDIRDPLIPYLSDRFGNGQLHYDANPIVNFQNPVNRKGLRIIQLDPNEYEDFYESWTRDLAEEERSELEPHHEKIIALTLTRENLYRSLDEVHRWLRTE